MNDKTYGVKMIAYSTKQRQDVSLAGYKVPYIEAYEHPDNAGLWALVLDDRIMTDYLSFEQLAPMISFMADAMAAAA